jgi:hypothetical protein
MPLIKTGGGVTQITGSIAGNTFFRNRSGAVMRTRTVPTNTKSARQVISRELFSHLDGTWFTTLTAEQRQSWDLYAKNVAMKNKLGESTHLTGQLHFIRSNQARMTAGLPLIRTAPGAPYALSEADPSFTPYASSSIQLIALYFDTTLPWVQENYAGMIVHVGKPINKTKNYYNGPWKFLGCILGSAGSPPASPSFLETLPNLISPKQKVCFKVQITRADGRLSNPSLFSTEVSDLALPFTPLLLENFNSYGNGNLNGQGSWSGSTMFQVEEATVFEGTKAIRNSDFNPCFITKLVSAKDAGFVSCMLRKDVSAGIFVTLQLIDLLDSVPTCISRAGMKGSAIGYYANSVFVPILTPYLIDTWYKMDIVFRTTPDHKCRYRVNDGSWSSWVSRADPGSVGPASKVTMETDDIISGGQAFFDYIH